MIIISKKHEKADVELRKVYCDTMLRLAEQDKRVIMLEADLMGSLGTKKIAEKYPDRVINCGIAESAMIGAACGASIAGLIPFTHTFGPFASRRVNDQVFMSGAFADANVKMLGSDAGITAEYNGGTHMPFDDAGIMRGIPNMTVIEFSDGAMVKNLLPKIKDMYGMVYMRMARKLSYELYEECSDFTIGKAAKLREGTDAAIFAMGYCVNEALKAAELLQADGISVSVYDMFTLKPVDAETVLEEARKTGAVVTAENHSVVNGLGSAVAEVLCEGYPVPLERVGIRDVVGEVGDVKYLAEAFKISARYIYDACKRAISRKSI